MNRSLLTVLILTSTLQVSFASSEPLRLIQTGPKQVKWMSQQEIKELSKKSHEAGHCGGFMDITDQKPTTLKFFPDLLTLGIIENRKPQFQNLVDPLLKEVSAQNLYDSVKSLSTFPNRQYKNDSGEQAALWIKTQFEAIAKNRTDISVRVFKHAFKQPSIIATIAGTKNPHEIIVIGAHEDSINWEDLNSSDSQENQATMIAPGADDDASGVATVLEVFRVFVQSGIQPERTIEFMTYAAEEVGLLGSQDIATQYSQDKKNVIAVMQFDMTMYPADDKLIALIGDYTNKYLNEFTGKLIDTYVKQPWKMDTCGYGCSDHASWNNKRFAAAFPFESADADLNPNIHSKRDGLTTVVPEFGSHFAKLGLSFIIELSKDR